MRDRDARDVAEQRRRKGPIAAVERIEPARWPRSSQQHEHSGSETAANEMKFLGVMSQYEMEILTRLFPKCAQTLADVLRNRPRPLGVLGQAVRPGRLPGTSRTRGRPCSRGCRRASSGGAPWE
jgi:hypothetical protein